jgi:hypothetical protein
MLFFVGCIPTHLLEYVDKGVSKVIQLIFPDDPRVSISTTMKMKEHMNDAFTLKLETFVEP